jgi:hypothetical protein
MTVSKRLSIIAVVVLSAALVIGNSASAHVRYARTSDGNGWSPTDVKQAIRFSVHRWHVPGGPRKAIAVARCESGFRPHAHDTPTVGGVYQHKYRYWRGRFRKYNPHHGWRLPPSIFNARTNVVISIRMASRHGWGPWSCA